MILEKVRLNCIQVSSKPIHEEQYTYVLLLPTLGCSNHNTEFFC